MKIVGVLALIGKEYSCNIGDSIELIAKQNTHLSADEVQRVFEITREQQDINHIEEQF